MSKDFEIYEFEEETRKDTEVVIFQCLKGCWHVNAATPMGKIRLIAFTLRVYKTPLSSMVSDTVTEEQLQSLYNDLTEAGIVWQRLTMKKTQLALDVMDATKRFDMAIERIEKEWMTQDVFRGL